MRDQRERLLDILDAIEQVEKYTSRGRAIFETDELVQVWVVHHLQIIGEAARALPEELKQAHPEIPWPVIVGMRNIIVHEYFIYDLNEAWKVAEKDLPDLKQKITAILDEMPGHS
jgi:uncharacterized protein with HEPN domain